MFSTKDKRRKAAADFNQPAEMLCGLQKGHRVDANFKEVIVELLTIENDSVLMETLKIIKFLNNELSAQFIKPDDLDMIALLDEKLKKL